MSKTTEYRREAEHNSNVRRPKNHHEPELDMSRAVHRSPGPFVGRKNLNGRLDNHISSLSIGASRRSEGVGSLKETIWIFCAKF
jgi:hypothetical protein